MTYELPCGDCLNLMARMPAGSVDLIVTDPPYNVGKQFGSKVNDNKSEKEYLAWYEEFASACYRVQRNGYLYVSCTMSRIWTLRSIWERAGYSFQVMLLWHGPNFATAKRKSRYQWMVLYEPIFMFLKGKRLPMLSIVRGVKTDAVIRIARPQRNFKGFQKRAHPTQKPVELYWTLLARTPGETILDPFMGSGATGIAAVRLGRNYIGMDIEQRWVGVARERIETELAQAHPVEHLLP